MNKAEQFDWTFEQIGGLEPLRLGRKNPLSFTKQTIFTGVHTNSNGEEFEVDRDLIDHWAETGTAMLSEGAEIPLPSHHTEDRNFDRGKITKFQAKNDRKGRYSLYLSGVAADTDVVSDLKKNDISLYSPIAKKVGKKWWARPILHACVTPNPCVKGLEGFQLQLSAPTIQLAEDMKECPECAKRKAMAGKKKKRTKKRETRELLSLASQSAVNDRAKAMARQTGQMVAVVPQENGTLILAESELNGEYEVDGYRVSVMVAG